MIKNNREIQWLSYFSGLRRKLNGGWFLQCFEPAFLILLVFLLCVTFIQKSYYPDLFKKTEYVFSAGLTSCFFIALTIAWFRAKKKFYSLRDVILHYDEKYRFNCSLLLAYEKKQEWPPLPDHLHESFTFKWRHNSVFLFMALIIISSAQWIPVAAKSLETPLQQPATWRNSERLIELLEEDETLEQNQVEKFRKRLKELQAKEAQEWFNHSTLEASESLLESLEQTSQEHHKNMANVADVLKKMEKLRKYLKKVQKEEIKVSKDFQAQLDRTLQRLEQQWDEEMQDLMRQYLKMNKDMMKDLKSLNPSDYAQNNNSSIDKEKLKALLEKMLAQSKKQCQECNGKSEECASCQGSKPGQGGQGQGFPGIGGINRGPGSGGDPLGDEESENINGKIQAVNNDDKRNMRPGELLGTSNSEHILDKKKWKGNLKGGETSHKGDGGDAVWKDNLLPEEQEILRSLSK